MKNKRFGVQVNHSEIVLHTQEAIALCDGKRFTSTPQKTYRVPSVYTFGAAVNAIWDCAKRDDPYAEYTLIKIEDRIRTALDKIELYEKLTDRKKSRWKQPEGLTLAINEALIPKTITLDKKVFKTPHATSLLLIIVKLDVLIRKLLTYRQFNIIKNSRFRTIRRRTVRYIRAIVLEYRSFKPTGVTRSDILNKTEKGEQAVDQLGMIPLSVVKRVERSEYGPTPNS